MWWSNDTLLLLTTAHHALLVNAHAPSPTLEQLLHPPPPALDASAAVVAAARGGAWVAWGGRGGWRVACWSEVPAEQRVQQLAAAGSWDEAMATAKQHGIDTDTVLRYVWCC